MDGDAEVARELERLRTELLEFVVDALGERMANGDYPELSERLAEAIDRRVDEAVARRVSAAEWPDADRFVDEVLAAAGERSGDAGPVRAARRPASSRRRLSNLHLGLIMLVAVLLTAAATYFVLQGWSGGTTMTNVAAPIAPDPVVYDANGVQIEGGNAAAGNTAAPPPANTVQNTQGPTP